ncbi:thiamine pyrophosphate-dependent enzyme [Micromonospora sp. BRA006-A]|nr:thiamine pyrophosphate-dependent enzyme [Micromonospora sp. BRA006-A]
MQRDGSDTVVVTYFGDGAASGGDASEAMNIAAVNAAPMVFFCQNNQWAISTPTASQTRTPIHRRGAGFGLRSGVGRRQRRAGGVRGDVRGDRARPVRRRPRDRRGHHVPDGRAQHVGRPDPVPHRRRAGGLAGADPLARVEALMRAEGWTGAFLDGIQAEADELADRTRRECLALTAPDLADAFATVLADVPRFCGRNATRSSPTAPPSSTDARLRSENPFHAHPLRH